MNEPIDITKKVPRPEPIGYRGPMRYDEELDLQKLKGLLAFMTGEIYGLLGRIKNL